MRTKPKKSRVTKSGRTILSPYEYRKLKMLTRLKQNNECADCGRPDPTDLHHIIPRTRGRHDDTEANTVLLCRPCHDKYSPQPQWTKTVTRTQEATTRE